MNDNKIVLNLVNNILGFMFLIKSLYAVACLF